MEGTSEDFAVEMVRVFQKDKVQTALSLMQEDVSKRCQRNGDDDILMEFCEVWMCS